ncbi:hypothetical protein [Leucobacter sp. cx-169]|uniref:hypothetical protein n=1 Tax=Leucobacter sp. cx-169 TaxID=2770549 RepID=UPI00165D94FF|nr:hypothetical protein [Leucobacter sp. cx-169]MBC9927215.1 hypothetical protein [Leucobacter sp. cx-169]
MPSSPSKNRVLAALNAHQRLDHEQCGVTGEHQPSHSLDDWTPNTVDKMRAAIAAADEAMPEPVVSMVRFHQSYMGLPDLWHVSCKDHPEFGTCAESGQARQDLEEHVASAHAGTPDGVNAGAGVHV